MADMVKKSRSPIGDRNGSRKHPDRIRRGDEHGSVTYPDAFRKNAVINERTASMIKAAFRDGMPVGHIAKAFGCSYGVTYNVATGRNWKRVP
jgi:hypothetical protein